MGILCLKINVQIVGNSAEPLNHSRIPLVADEKGNMYCVVEEKFIKHQSKIEERIPPVISTDDEMQLKVSLHDFVLHVR